MLPSPSLRRWLRHWWPAHLSAQPARRSSPRHALSRPLLELMEDRLTPSVSFVLGNPVPAPPSSMLFTVTRTGDLTPAVQVNYTTLDGSGSNAAHAGTDYTATSGTLLFPANQTTETISVPVLNDTVFQANLTFGVVLSSPLASAAFAGPQSFPAIGGTVAVGDLNGDGKPDLVVANSGDNTVLVLLNTTARGATTPNFAPLQSFATGSRPFSVTVADVNSDGKPDLITANYSDTVSVLLNTTAPGATTLSFAPQQSFATGSGLFSVAVADINGDGLPDLITSNKWDQTVGMLLNTTASGASIPSFGPQQTLATGIDPSSNLAVADVNGDGLPDLLVVSGIDSLWVVLNTTAPGATTASFAPPQTFNTGSSSGQVSLAVADVNLDGKPDIIATGTQVSAHGDLAYMVSVLLNTTAPGATTASFAPQQTFPTGYNRTSLAVADVNGDGLPDLVVAGGGTSPGGALSVLLNTMVPGAAVPSFAPQQTFPTGSYPSSVAVADVNGDALPDIVTANGFDGTVSVLLNTTAPVNFAAVQAVSVTAITSVTPARAVLGQTFTVSAIVTPGLPQPNAPTGTVTFFDDTTPLGVVPIGSDGIATLTVSAHHGGTLSLRATYSGDVNFLPSETAVTPLPVLAQNTVGVFDPATGTWYLRGSNSPGVPDAGQFAYGAPGWVGVPGDWNGDGVSTVGVFDPGTAIWYLRNSNSPGAPDIQPFAYGMASWIPVVGDWTGSGHAGIGIFDPTTATFYLRNSDSPGAPDFVIHYGGAGWKPVVGDWDGNGTFTIGVVDPAGVWYLRNSNSPGAPDITPFAYGGSGWTPVAGDWNGDGVTTIGVFDAGGQWYLRNENGPGAPDVATFAYGAGGWQPVAGFWNAPVPAALSAIDQAFRSVVPGHEGSALDEGDALTAVLGGDELGELLGRW